MKTLIHAPLLKFTLCFTAGIFLQPLLPLWAICCGIPVGIALVYCIYQDKRFSSRWFERWVALLIYTAAVLLGGIRSWSESWQQEQTPLAYFNCEHVTIQGEVISPVKVNQYGQKARIRIWAVARDSSWIPVQAKGLLYAPKDQDSLTWAQYDTVLARVSVRDMRSRYPDYLAWLKRQGIQHALYADTLIAQGRALHLNSVAHNIQSNLSKQLKSLLPESSTSSVAAAMFLGDKQALAPELREEFAAAGLSHLLAISGLHIGIVFLLLNLLLAPLHIFRHGQRIKNILILLVLLIYMLITGASPAVVRAVLMFVTILLFRIGYQRYHMLNLVAIAALIQMAFKPGVVHEIGFQLSYCAVLGIVCGLPYFEKIFPSTHPWLKKIYAWIGVSIVATLATLPLVLLHFGQFPTYFLLANLLVSGLAFPLVLLGFLATICCYIPILNELLATVASWLIDVLLLITREIAHLPHAVLDSWSLDHPAWGYLFLELSIACLFMLLPRLLAWAGKERPRLSASQAIS